MLATIFEVHAGGIVDNADNHLIVSNWKGDIRYRPRAIVRPSTVEEIKAIVLDTASYPTPLRVKGSHHSVTRCIVADGGTVLDMTGMNQILQVDREAMTITMQAGVLLKDASSLLEQLGLQFYVNVEIGNLTVGSGACCGTKKASFFGEQGQYESGQVSSYVERVKVVQADGTELVVDKRNPKLLEALRSSYGMLGVVVEVTYKIKQLRPMSFKHEVYSMDEFEQHFPALASEDRSLMLYIFPFIDRIVVERRWAEGTKLKKWNSWWLRNFAWKTLTPSLGRAIEALPFSGLRSALLNGLFQGVVFVLGSLHGTGSSPEDQIIRYPHVGGPAAYTFSLWAFDEADGKYLAVLRDYFKFCKDYYAQHGYRCNMPSVGYRVAKEDNILFSYARNGFALTVDPVSTGGEAWDRFVEAFNERCSRKSGRPLFNQTPGLTPEQAQRAFGPQIKQFLALREQYDPKGRFYTPWFQGLFADTRKTKSSGSVVGDAA